MWLLAHRSFGADSLLLQLATQTTGTYLGEVVQFIGCMRFCNAYSYAAFASIDSATATCICVRPASGPLTSSPIRL